MTAIVELKNATKVVKNGFDEEKIILNDVSLEKMLPSFHQRREPSICLESSKIPRWGQLLV